MNKFKLTKISNLQPHWGFYSVLQIEGKDLFTELTVIHCKLMFPLILETEKRRQRDRDEDRYGERQNLKYT